MQKVAKDFVERHLKNQFQEVGLNILQAIQQ